MKRFFLLLTALFLICQSGFSQHVRINPDKVTEEELALKEYEPDTTASLVMLYRRINVTVGPSPAGDIGCDKEVYERWKVMKETGKDKIDYEIFYYNSDKRKDEVRDIKVVTYNLGPDGKLQSHKLSRNGIFREKYSEGIYRLTFAPEAVQVGSVVEVSYVYSTSSVNIEPVMIQEEYPVNLADIDIAYAEFFMYNHIQMGFASATFRQESEPRTFSIGTRSQHYSVFHDIYRIIDLPAAKEEPFSFCPEQYRFHLLYNLCMVKFPGQNVQDLSSTWKKVDDLFIGQGLIKNFTRKLKAFSKPDEIIGSATKPDKVILALRQYVLDNVEWNGKRSLIPEEGSSVWKTGKGTDADISALLACALNQIDGYKAEPVLVKLRSNGHFIDFRVSTGEYDRLILRIEAPGGKVYFLDVCQKDGYLNLLHPNLLTNAARLISLAGVGSWINLEAASPFAAGNYTVQAAFDSNGVLGGTYRKTAFYGESMADKLTYHRFDTHSEWAEKLEDGLSDVEVSDPVLAGALEYSSKCETGFNFRTSVTAGSDRLYIDPFIDKFHSATTFKEPERTIPVDFPYRYKLYYAYELSIPDGYEVEALPEDITMVCPALDDSFFIIGSTEEDGKVMITFRFQLNTVLVLKEQYEDLRLFWEKTAVAEQSVIVLKKK